MLAHRLVTLVESGGNGKTRLAVAVAATLGAAPADAPADARQSDGFGQGTACGEAFDGVTFVSLVGCDSAASVTQALARALQRPGATSLEESLPALAGQRVLLVLLGLAGALPARRWRTGAVAGV